MHYSTFLPNACIGDVLKGIHLLMAAAVAAMRENPHRHQHLALYVAELAMAYRPIYARDPRRRLFGIFRELPHPGLPCGDRLLVVGIPYMPDCDRFGTGECCGSCRSCIPMEVRVDPRFPLDEIETRWKLGTIFGLDESSIVNTHPSWLTKDPACDDVLRIQALAPGAHARQPSAATLKLEAALEELPNIRSNRHLMPQYAIWYEEEHGCQPVDLKGSFRHAVNGCIKRIEARRNGLN
ncbi:MAG: hypothetical protein U0X20_00035 [Caldilineaceae bacterium]